MNNLFLLFCTLYTTISFAQTAYQELPDPKPKNEELWKQVKTGTYVSFASPDNRYAKSNVPAVSPVLTNWQTKAWKGEKVHTQILIWTTKPLKNTSLFVSDLKGSKQNKIPAGKIKASFLRYVMVDGLNEKGVGCGIPSNLEPSLEADVIDNAKASPIAANTTQPVWLSISIPADAPAGVYKGAVRVIEGKNEILGNLDYSVEVINRTLPAPKQWQYHLDLWQNPDAIARMHQVEKWSDDHLKVMKPYMESLANAGQKVITTTLIHDPWNSQTYDVYSSMIKWTRKKNGSWSYDYTIFDKWVSYMMALGIDRVIECYSMIPWNLKFYYYDEALGKETVLVAEPGTPEYNAHWQPMLADFAKHLKKKGWFNKTTIAMDERPMVAMQKAIAVIKGADKDFKISLAGNYHPEIEKDLFDYCVASNQKIDEKTMQARKKAGSITTFYTCCAEGFPNTFTFSPLAESAWLAWHAANKGYDGYLRWAFNSWPQNPLQDSRFGKWSSGDTYFIYPQNRSSIRFERLIEGIEDFEKIRILKEEFKRKDQPKKLQQLDTILAGFEIDALKTQPAGPMLTQAQQVLNNL
ncbi:hypothetical protein AAE02nite_05780 [Adhaeribacter aerolatus]|uniref:Uncharacterized protein n=1 Tax=Adhaeribacter aerolatus TaxID=670289 RepID=A0A512AT72_9BACT|nr:DUF4091 domain-containing protein [Adhaeribacter aerolatus]GEO02914.1 hypothetical protein AAE02nite_05780 [Adhaeribacter aerolatus]